VIVLETKTARNSKDIMQKYTSVLFRDATLEFYGIKTAKIKEMINVELPVIEVGESSMDFVFLLEDDSYLHYEFQTSYKKDDLIRFANYDWRLYANDKRKITTVIIYSSDVKKADDSLDIGCSIYAPSKVMMYEYDGNVIYSELESKLRTKQELTDIDMLNLIFLPLMRNDIPKQELATKSIELANTIPDKDKRDACIASAMAFMNKYLSDEDKKRLLEGLKMADIVTMFITDERIDIAKSLLSDDVPIKAIIKATGLDLETLKALQEQQEQDNDDE
jgi:hypothetical protein